LNFENVSGSFYADTITGNSADNVLYGREGADTIDGGEGNDILIGGSGNDTLTSGAGMDIFMYLSWDLGSGDLETGGLDTTDATIGDKIYFKMQDFTNLTVYGSLINNIWQTENVASSLDASNSIALVNIDGDYQIHIDFDGDTNADFTIDVADDVTHAVAAGINGYGTISFETAGIA
ncbi:calcium-binding protein, partial [Magnetovibrio blakemorei]|uniref:calcium-binding protein n=1 Tax=Magnetovibrio blakemorei TaxID=28181 RepID=UPI003899073B